MDIIISELIGIATQCLDKAKKQLEKHRKAAKCYRVSLTWNERFNKVSVEVFLKDMPEIKLEKQPENKLITFTEEQLLQLRACFEQSLNHDTNSFFGGDVALLLSFYPKANSTFTCPFPQSYGVYFAVASCWKKGTENGKAAYKLQQVSASVEVSPKRSDVVFENEFVLCTAKQPENKIVFSIKNECAKAYESMLEFLINQLENGFSHKYSIEFDAKEKSYLTDLAKTDTNSFFTSCAKYPELFVLTRKYFHTALQEYASYTDTDDAELKVPCGGYAAFALGMASADNFDVLSEFMMKHDSEHAIAPRYFVYTFIDYYGWSAKTVRVFCDCIYHGNDVFVGAEELGEEVLEGILSYARENELKEYQLEHLANGIWDNFEEERAKATGNAADLFSELARMMEA